ncbi:hypothetical protein MPH_01003 [Macrophomina phaseolina MS6]|uniref:Uncharacterized protein n=1 Tax=Macrophomina phaseolina (strain MS6) TaxID=1126212 RepID=K2S426_MACPH|nr:hypothetical protein MPH_01003 [Macrophomina phaseolina MS6]
MSSLYRAVRDVFTSAQANHDQKRLSSHTDTSKPTSTIRHSNPATNPFSFNNYALKPAPKSNTAHLPFDPADLTRRLERYLASLDPDAATAASTSSPHAPASSSSSSAAAQHNGSAAASSHLKPQRSQPRSATASAQSPASPNPAAAAATKLGRAPTAARSATDPLLAARSSSLGLQQRPDDWASLEAIRRDARRAQRRSMALSGKRGLNAPVEAEELARRLGALNGDGKAMVELLRTRKSLPELRGSGAAGDVKRVSSVRANEKRAVVRREGSKRGEGDGRRGREELLQKQQRRSSGLRRSTVHDGEMWRVYVESQNAVESNSQAAGALRLQQLGRQKSKSKKRLRPLSTTELELKKGADWNVPGSAMGLLDTGSVTSSEGCKVEHPIGRRPDWSQRDEATMREGRLSPLHLHVPGFGRRSSTSFTEISQSEDERALSEVEGKRKSKFSEAQKNNRQSVCIAEATSSNTSATTTKKAIPRNCQPAMLQIPPHNNVTLQSTTGSSSRSPTSPPSITLSPVDPRISLELHPGFSPTNLLPIAQPPSPYHEARGQQQSPASFLLDHHQPKSATTQHSATLAPLPEIPPLPAPDRFSKTRPQSFAAPLRSSSTPVIAPPKKKQQHAQEHPPKPPTNVSWPGPRSRGASGGPLSSNPVAGGGGLGRGLSLFPAEDERMKKRKSVAFAEQMKLGSRRVGEVAAVGGKEGGSGSGGPAEKRPSTSYHAPVARMPAGVGALPPKGKGRRGELQHVGKGNGEAKREVAERGVMSPTRLVFWRRDSGVTAGAAGPDKGSVGETVGVNADEAVLPVARSPSRLAFWKRRATTPAA